MVKTAHLMTLAITLDPPHVIGKVPEGYRRVMPITGGTMSGRITGKVLPGGADWNLIKPDGTVHIWACYTLETDDGVKIMITNDGYQPQPDDPKIMAQLVAGETPDADGYYAWTRPTFEVADERYGYLNSRSFIGKMVPVDHLNVTVDIFEIL